MNEILRKLQGLWAYTKIGKRRAILAISMMIIGSLIFAAIPMIARSYIDYLVEDSEGAFDIGFSGLVSIIVAILILVVAWYVLYSRGRELMVRDVSGKKARDDFANKANRISVARLEDLRTGDIAASMSNDIPVVIRSMRFHIPDFFVQLAIILFIITMMFWISARLAIVYFVLLLFSYLLTRYIGKRMHRQMRLKQESIGQMNGYFSDVISSHSLVKIYGLEDKAMNNFNSIDEIQRGSYIRTTSAFGFIEPISRIIDNTGYYITAILGTIMIGHGSITFGSFLAFISYATIIGKPLASFSDSMNRIQIAAVSYDRMLEFKNEPEMPLESDYDDLDIGSVKGDIVFRDLSFTYPDGTKALFGLNLDIPNGSVVAIVGEEGSGKSTVSDMIMGFRTSNEGSLTLDGKNIADIKRNHLRKVIGTSSQDPFIFEGTVYFNLSQTCEKEDIERMSRLTGFDEYVKKLPKGYDTIIGGRGHSLSSGEKQLLSITRLLLYDPKIMIFDESSSDMDPLTSMTVFSSIRKNLKGKTVIIVDNTPTSVLNADKVVFMEKGRILDVGSHIELMDRNPKYVEMYRNMVF